MKRIRHGQTGVCLPHAAKALLCVLVALLALVPAYGQGHRRVTIDAKNATVAEVFSMIEKQSDVNFTYNNEQIAALPRVTFSVSGESIQNVLERCLRGSNLEWIVRGNTYVIRMKQAAQPTVSAVITGTVTGPDGKPMAGVSILLKGSITGTITDSHGSYTLRASVGPDSELEFSFLGMNKVTERVGERRTIDVKLTESAESIKGIVVTGYGNIDRRSFTGSAVTVTRQELQRVANRNAIDALQVFDPSLRISLNNLMGSDPNTLPDLTMRGQSGIGNMELDPMNLRNNPNAPVFILDGFEVSVEKIYDMDMNRIASMTILKDAAATAIYGSRAANGVIVIESVAPQPGKLSVSYNAVMTITAPDLSAYNLMNSREKIMAEEAAEFYDLTGLTPSEATRLELERLRKWDRVNSGVDTYWLAKPLQTEVNHKHSLYLEGGSENIKIGLDLRYDNQSGVMKGSSRNRVGAGFYVDYSYKSLQIKNHVTYDDVRSVASPYGKFSNYANKLPYDLFLDENGDYVRLLQQEYDNNNGWHASPGDLNNPLYEARVVSNFNKNAYTELANNLSLRWQIIDNLQLRGQLALSRKYADSKVFTDPLSGSQLSKQYPGELVTGSSTTTQINTNLFLNYVSRIGKNSINASFGFNTVERILDEDSSTYLGFPSGHLNSPQYAQTEKNKTTYKDEHTRLFGTFLSVNYTYDNIYLLDASCRLDGSSVFGSKKKYAPFWSAGVGLNIHNYEFMRRNLSLLSTLKIRATYGQVGNVSFGANNAKHIYDLTDQWYDTGSGVMLTTYGNDKLKWEVTNETNVGVNFGLWDDRITLNLEYYNKLTKDLITRVTIPSSTGFTSYYENMGEIRNRGFEVYLNIQAVKRDDLTVNIYGNLASNRNKILKISDALKAYNELVHAEFENYYESGLTRKDAKYASPILQYVEGGSLTSIFGMKSLGISPSDGEEIFLKPDGTITRTWNSYDQQIIGNTEPDAQGAFGVNAGWKGFFLYASFMYEFGGDTYNTTLATKLESVDLYNNNADRRVLSQRWQNPGDVAKYKAIQQNNTMTRSTSRFVQTNNTIRFKALTVGYDFKQKWVKDLGLGMLRVQATMNDVAYISNVRQERGLSYPFARVFDFSLNISF